MPKATYLSAEGKRSDVELASDIFDVQVNVPVMHEVVRAQLASARAGTHATKARGDVRGGGRKPWRQKGTGRARQGSRRSPQWVGGGIVHGPVPRDHSIRVNKKTKALALRSALTDRAREGRVVVVDLPSFDEPDTKKAVSLLSDWAVEGTRILIVFGRGHDEEARLNVIKSFRNLPQVLMVSYPTTYTVLAATTVIFTKQALDELSTSRATSVDAAVPPTTSAASAGTTEGDVGGDSGDISGPTDSISTEARRRGVAGGTAAAPDDATDGEGQ